ncbi:peptidase m20 [Lucifera butyrica]|uniref:Peptidase m20 n=1 Tax=Lucifera butyrica TaxID=1351585 RepID=A0A498RIB1_9FIRM|nr:M20/M25/M40 family metallo-hydrolase [Lucifera butyrica]VBB09822.1 peptidase m20 [Lucifera butyrica]
MSTGEKIKSIALELTRISSIVGTEGEVQAARAIYSYLAKLDYFQKNKDHLRWVPVPGDPGGRCTVLAYIEGGKRPAREGEKARTVLCLGHIDTVGVEDYGELKPYATRPEVLQEKLKFIQFSEETLAEINSPDWIFGRGIFDMKTGVAALMVMVEKFAGQAAELQGNLVFIAVPDEEGNSAGMLAAVPELERLAREKGWEFTVALNTDYMTGQYPGDENKYVYVGTVGKLLPSFYVYGEETHVGEAFNGLNANLLAAAVLNQIDFNTELCDIADGEVTLPPVSLHQRDLKQEYSVQTANAVSLYFNHATHASQPAEVLAQYKEQAILAFEQVIDKLNREYETFCRLSRIPYRPLPWRVQVLTYDELYQAVKAETGDRLDRIIEAAVREQQAKKADDREISLAIVQAVHKNYSDQNSKIIVYLAPPYYPHIFVSDRSEKERRLLGLIGEVIEEAQRLYDYKIVLKKFYPYISDLSYCDISHDERQIAALVENMPAWSRSYTLPIGELQSIGMPVVNIGPYGRDAHKLSERLSCRYSLDAMPFILEQTLERLLK